MSSIRRHLARLAVPVATLSAALVGCDGRTTDSGRDELDSGPVDAFGLDAPLDGTLADAGDDADATVPIPDAMGSEDADGGGRDDSSVDAEADAGSPLLAIDSGLTATACLPEFTTPTHLDPSTAACAAGSLLSGDIVNLCFPWLGNPEIPCGWNACDACGDAACSPDALYGCAGSWLSLLCAQGQPVGRIRIGSMCCVEGGDQLPATNDSCCAPTFHFQSSDGTFTYFAYGYDPVDSDEDLVPDIIDNCPTVNNDQTDTDQDGVGDACDNCPYTYNPDQKSQVPGGIGNACNCDLTPTPPLGSDGCRCSDLQGVTVPADAGHVCNNVALPQTTGCPEAGGDPCGFCGPVVVTSM